MRTFDHIDARTMDEACEILDRYQGRAKLNAGGTDLLSVLKGDILPVYPEAIINVKTIPGLDYITEDGNVLRIGALARLSDIGQSSIIKKRYRVLAEAALSVGSPQIRNVATIGGNLCQDSRCWYYRYPRHIGGPMQCLRKGNGPCLAVKGDNRYHAILKGRKCYSVCPSDMAVALTAIDAQITIAGPKGERSIAVKNFYHPLGNALETNEMIREIEIPKKKSATRQKYIKFTLRKPIDFAIVSVAGIIALKNKICTDASIVLGAVAPMPYRAEAAEDVITGHVITKGLASKAAEKALEDAKPLSMNGYKIEIAKTLVRRLIMDVFHGHKP
jgi:xanthine dehydrogenase YagS FAD-binding subunit